MNEIVDKYHNFVMILMFIIISIAMTSLAYYKLKDTVRKSLRDTDDENKKHFRDFQVENIQLEIKIKNEMKRINQRLRLAAAISLAVCVLIFGLFWFNLEWIINSRILWSI